jgi:peptidoglycan L-alanyl-D-glutamate endopeptidase CwlK
MYQLSDRSSDRLMGVHTDLVKIVYRAIQTTEIDFGVSEGLRSLKTQKEYLAKGVTTTLNSRHLSGHAVDVFAYVGGIARWEMPLYEKIHDAFKSASEELGIPVEWGGGWKSFPDGPHFQLPWNEYPKVSFDSKS